MSKSLADKILARRKKGRKGQIEPDDTGADEPKRKYQKRETDGRKARATIQPGTVVGWLRVIQQVRDEIGVNPNLRKRWRCECIHYGTSEACAHCEEVNGRETIRNAYIAGKNPAKTKLSGCTKERSLKAEYNQEYRIYLMMHVRCYDKRHMAYHRYGGRGIRVADEFNRYKVGIDTGFKNWLEEVGPRPSPGHSIDRIDVNGNYAPGNLRWATDLEQAANKRSNKKAELELELKPEEFEIIDGEEENLDDIDVAELEEQIITEAITGYK